MASVICVMGESGSGKTTAMRNLDPATTYYLDADKKGLAWRGWAKKYNHDAKNYQKCDNPDAIARTFASINGRAPHIKTVVVDTLNGVMIADEMRRMKEKGYDKWTDLAASVYSLIDYALTMRDEITVVFVCHVQTDADDFGNRFTHVKTSGKKLDKICIESKMPIVLLARCIDGQYVFEVSANNSTAKTPMDLFSEKTIENDLCSVIQKINEYNGQGEEPEQGATEAPAKESKK